MFLHVYIRNVLSSFFYVKQKEEERGEKKMVRQKRHNGETILHFKVKIYYK